MHRPLHFIHIACDKSKCTSCSLSSQGHHSVTLPTKLVYKAEQKTCMDDMHKTVSSTAALDVSAGATFTKTCVQHCGQIWTLANMFVLLYAYKLFLLPPGLSVATRLGRANALGMAAASTLELHFPGSLPCTTVQPSELRVPSWMPNPAGCVSILGQ